MEIKDFIVKFSDSKENQMKAIFNSLFIISNRLQTLFDRHIPDISLKQFMLLSLVRQSEETLTFTKLGSLLGCSRQNIKKLAGALEKKGYITVEENPADKRAFYICPTTKINDYFENVFFVYEAELANLFKSYSDEEIELLFTLFMRLYEGTEYLETVANDGR